MPSPVETASGLPGGCARRVVALLAGAAVALVALLASSVPAAAVQSAPAWTTGDYWEYAVTGASSDGTERASVEERTRPLLIAGGLAAVVALVVVSAVLLRQRAARRSPHEGPKP